MLTQREKEKWYETQPVSFLTYSESSATLKRSPAQRAWFRESSYDWIWKKIFDANNDANSLNLNSSSSESFSIVVISSAISAQWYGTCSTRDWREAWITSSSSSSEGGGNRNHEWCSELISNHMIRRRMEVTPKCPSNPSTEPWVNWFWTKAVAMLPAESKSQVDFLRTLNLFSLISVSSV